MRIFRLFVAIALICFAPSQRAQGVVPPPPGGYPNFTTAAGDHALQALTLGLGNTALGTFSLFTVTTGNFNTAVGAGSLDLNTADSNTATGAAALLFNTTGTANTATGTTALEFNETGSNNTAVGAFALFSNTTGTVNVAMGWNALPRNDDGSGNVAIGEESLVNNVSGGVNTVVGAMAGANILAGSNNVYIGWAVDANGPFDESDTIRIGRPPNATSPALHCFIGGIAAGGATANVQVDATTGELLQVVSSARYKENIKPMDQASEAIFALKPVTFRYKKKLDAKGIPQFGLIAEEVAKVNPDLVILDREGRPDSVRYEGVNAMLLNEFLKQHKKTEKLEATVASLIATVKEQAAQIQKVSTQLELSKAAPQTVLNRQ
jgi:hypothetical protein